MEERADIGTRSRASANEQEIPLTGERAEFRTALRDEIWAARRSSASAGIPLINGRKIAEVGGSFQYAFSIQNALNAPGDQPADLNIPGRAPAEATLISVEGLAVTISVPEFLGETVPYGTLRSDLTLLLRRLIDRIEKLAEVENPAGDRLLGFAAVSGSPAEASIDGLNPEQAEAVGSALGRDTTFIWGPPGTGKTRAIGTIGEQLYRRERSALVVSHTNAAVDQALLHIAAQLDADLAAGSVLRVGDPADQRLKERPELLAITHVKQRTAELQRRRDELEEQKEIKSARVLELGRLIDLCEWVAEGGRDIADSRTRVEELRASEQITADLQARVEGLQARLPELAEARAEAEQRIADREQRDTLRQSLPEIHRRQQETARLAEEAPATVATEREALEESRRVEPLRAEADRLPGRHAAEADARVKRKAHEQAVEGAEAATVALTEAEDLLRRAEEANALQRRWRGLPKPEEHRPLVIQQREAAGAAQARAEDAAAKSAAAEMLYARTVELGRLLSSAIGVPRPAEQERRVARAEAAAAHAIQAAESARAELAEAGIQIKQFDTDLEAFAKRYGAEPAKIVEQTEAHIAELGAQRRNLSERETADAFNRDSLRNQLWQWLRALRGWGLDVDASRRGVEIMLQDLETAYRTASREVEGQDVALLRTESRELNDDIRRANAELAEIEEQMKVVEATVIAEARVVATTLTRAYTRESVHARRYDTVILDEASMAPIPALWAAAALAESNVVLVGDFKQLPPIKHSEHELADRWLGRDVFKASGVQDAYEKGQPPAYFVQLNEQFRMNPAISAIPNALIYDSTLRDGVGTDLAGGLDGWYRPDWGHDTPVLLVDTGSTNAWVTSVDRGGSGSRLNFLSGTVCLDLAVRMLREDRPTARPGDHARIIIASPYRPQARLLEIMIREQGLQDEITAGTAHTFQGSEAPIVIFDLVVDEPHWRVALFTPDFDDTNRRLLNVALTRAQDRLVIVGDFDYARKNGKKAFLSRLLRYAADRYPSVDATDLVPTGLAARAAHAQRTVHGGTPEPASDRMVMTQEDFDAYLPGDLAAARDRVVIYSPFITERRLAMLEPQIKAVVERRVPTFVVTKAREDRGKREATGYRELERTLQRWGVTVIHKPRMHEKLVFIDDRIVWAGSLNPLSFSDTQEVMARYDNGKVVEDYAGVMRLDEMLALYQAGQAECPVCGSELVPAEGRTGIYWKCVVPGCHTRSLDAAAPKDGKLVCQSCEEGVEFVELPSGPHWRCTKDKHHRQRVVPNHLKLPKMRDVVVKAVGKRGLNRLEKDLAARRNGNGDQHDGVPAQAELFTEAI